MPRRITALALVWAAALGCSSSAPVANQMAITPKPEPQESGARPVPLPVPNPNASDGIAARINNEIITWKDVKDALKEIKSADLSADLKKSKLRDMAEERLFLQAAGRNNLKISEQELDDAQRRDMKMYGGEDEFLRIVRIRWGTLAKYREDKRRQMLVFKLYRHILQKSWSNPDKDTPGLMLDFVSPEEIREHFEKNKEKFQAIERISFMRIGLQFASAQGKEIKQAVAESLLRKIDEGAEFAMLAYFYSDVRRAKDFRDMGVARKDVEGFYTRETIHYLFDTMKEGQISPIIEDGQTLNIFKMEQKVNQKAETFDEAQIKIRNELESQRREENRRRLRDHLVKDAYIWPADLFSTE